MWDAAMSTSRSGLRRIIKWVGLTLCILLLVTWVGTYAGGVFIRLYPNHVVVSAGGVRYLRYPIAPRRPAEVRWMEEPLNNMHALPYVVWSKEFLPDGSQIGPDWWFDLPFWFLLLMFGFPTLIAWRRDRVKPGHCRTCEYNLTGNVSGVCPECGTEIKPS